MKILKYLMALGALIWWALVAVPFLSEQHVVLIVITSLFVVLIVTNFTLRRDIAAKRYFTSKWNIFTSLHSQEMRIPIAAPLLQEKFEEELQHSTFNLITSDHSRKQILATTRLSFKSWGENIYITFISDNDYTRVTLESVTVFQIIDYEKNTKTIAQFVHQLENSFTV